ncbi:hypothetical protein PYW08_005568 [Mythimna loreyi]|uniref:Uncharacterized protein n=1 Tax=Mythimna loreyi TaxID=667449 RepID=A0ACC2QJI1_9NEOP|nr:hypothetical protein PYW08_005568 [Mythimna loreyi]
MRRQSSMTNYFKSQATPIPSPMSTKKRSLSLKRTPGSSPAGKSPKTPTLPPPAPKMPLTTSSPDVEVKKDDEIITLSSDSESEVTPAKKRNVGSISVRSIDSLRDSTPACTGKQQPIAESRTSTGVSNSSVEIMEYDMSPGPLLGQSPRTPSSRGSSTKEFYSPNKKRVVKMKSPVKRNLARQFGENSSPNSKIGNKEFSQNFDRDDKTGFLLSIIAKYLKSETLKPLLDESSQLLLENCMEVTKPGMRLMCRLYWRQPGWFRAEELGQIAMEKKKDGDKEVMSSPDLINMLTSLKSFGLITQAGSDGEPNLQFDEYVKLLKRPEILEIAKGLKLKIQSKQDAAEALRTFSKSTQPITNFFCRNKVNNNSNRVLDIFKSKIGNCYKMSDLARTTFHNLYVLMYLGIDYATIRDKKLELMLINEKINRETFPIDKDMVVDDASVVFQNRAEFDRYLQAHVVYEKYLEETDLNKKCELVKEAHKLFKGIADEDMSRYKSLPTWLRRFTPPNIYVKILESGVQELKKQKTEEYYKIAVEMLDTLIGQIDFRQHKKANWYAEKALILHSHLNSSEQAAIMLLEGFESEEMTEEMKDAMRPRALKIANQQNILLEESLREQLRSHADKESILERTLSGDHIHKQPMDNYNQKGKLKFELHTKEGRSTLTCEEYCIAHYINNGQYTDGEHWEGRIASTIFFLLFWDIIYTKPRDVTGIFLSYYQRYPLDMFSNSFYLNRKTVIEERLLFIQECTEAMMLAIMKSNWDQRPESEISEVQRSMGWETVRDVTSCLHARGVLALCRRLATNYGYAKSGFPDLTLWNVHTKKIKFVEVKTDADKPSIKQLQWLQYLLENGVDAGFCYVGVNTTRSRARPTNSQ